MVSFLLRTIVSLTAVLVLAAGCRQATPPPSLLGDFTDDYGIRYSIAASEWVQENSGQYHVDSWHPGERFLIARNDSSNPGEGGLWTRIDWVELGGPDGYDWAFCYAIYDAATRDDALRAAPSARETPRTGCGGFPFSRMKRR